MKILLRVIGALVACAILALVILRFTGLDPQARRAGLWLSGNAKSCPSDWTFAAKNQTLMVETHPWYHIAHSVNIFFVTDSGKLYLHGDYPPGGTYPFGKTWTTNVARNSNVRIKVGDQLFACRAVLLNDPDQFSTLFEDFRKKYPRSPYSNYSRRPDVYFFRVMPR